MTALADLPRAAAKLPNRLALPFHMRAMDVGTAGEHLVCADLLIAGFRAFGAAQGLPYDVIVDVGDRLLRITVKTTREPKVRISRTGSRPCYQFNITRSATSPERSRPGGKKYTLEDADLIALVALDIRRVAYLPMSESLTIMHLDSPAHPVGTNKFGPKRSQRKVFEQFSLVRALEMVTR